jgi:hypothetical protein
LQIFEIAIQKMEAKNKDTLQQDMIEMLALLGEKFLSANKILTSKSKVRILKSSLTPIESEFEPWQEALSSEKVMVTLCCSLESVQGRYLCYSLCQCCFLARMHLFLGPELNEEQSVKMLAEH